eukprot:1196088-Prorocentrum_minimum.AAC.6
MSSQSARAKPDREALKKGPGSIGCDGRGAPGGFCWGLLGVAGGCWGLLRERQACGRLDVIGEESGGMRDLRADCAARL